MAEMTAAQAIEVLHNNQYQKHIGNGDYDYIHPLIDTEAKGIESLIQQQAQEIERLNGCLNFEQHYLGRVGTHADGCYKWGPGHWECAVQEVQRLNRMIKLVLNRVTGDMAECHRTHVCQQDFTGKSQAESDNICIECWNKYLESEVADR